MGFQGKIIDSKRSLGQNFFVNKNLAQQISDIVLKQEPDVIVEIGPGTGAFTQFLVDKNINIFLIEKDNLLAKELEERFLKPKVLNIDFLNWDFSELKGLENRKILFFGSLPYNVSKQIIKKIIKSKYFNTNAYFVIQKEVAQKYVLKDPDNNFLSVSTHIYADVKKLFDISRDSFKPKPNVESSFVRFSPNTRNRDVTIACTIEEFEKFLKICFKQPRKTLKNNLKDSYVLERVENKQLLTKRGQHLSLNDFLSLFCNIK